ncbi:hypothetical protein [Deinococcus sp. NW-56]|uniref:hypothetical protein n=1 Tax=Deinococcus sp. NW-56 TaxID=2080419 RepID=UPI000CF497AB|nr:hypothetical protein [Deinococcus sp. NW-56]
MDDRFDVAFIADFTDLSKRTVQSIVRMYSRVTGDPVATVRRRNFQQFSLTREQRDRVIGAIREVARGQLSYEDVFARYAGQPAVPAPDPLTELRVEITDLREQIEGLTEAVVRLTVRLERQGE